jgi:hypothetical protein
MSEINRFSICFFFVLSGTFILHTYKTKYILTNKYSYHRERDRSSTPSIEVVFIWIGSSIGWIMVVFSIISSNEDERLGPRDKSSGCWLVGGDNGGKIFACRNNFKSCSIIRRFIRVLGRWEGYWSDKRFFGGELFRRFFEWLRVAAWARVVIIDLRFNELLSRSSSSSLSPLDGLSISIKKNSKE